MAEVIAGPWEVGAEPGRHSLSAVLDRLRDVEERWERAPETRFYDPARAERTTLAELFEDRENPQYKVTAEFRDVQVVRYSELSGDAPLFVQLSVGVPLGGGVLAALAELHRGITVPVRPLEKAAHGAMRFGWQVAALYVLYLTGVRGDAQLVEDVTALMLDPDVVSVAEVMALAFIQLSAVLLAMNGFGQYPKMHMALAVRQWLRKIWAELDPQVQRFFAELVGEIRALFEAEFDAWFPRWKSRYNRKRSLRKGAPVDLWALEITRPLTRASVGTVGDLFDEILRPDPDRRPIRQEDFEISPADSGDGLDTSRGSGLPLVVLEMRVMVVEGSGDNPADLPPGTRRWDDFQMLTGRIGRLSGVAEQGEAAAEFAHRLSASQEGRSLTASLRQVVLARGAERVSAIGKLRREVASYLESFPVQRPELEQALEPAARLGAPGLAQADPDETRTARVIRALLGSGHQVTDLEIARVVLVARSLGMPLGQVKRWLASLGRAVWVHDQDFPAGGQVMDADVARGFGFLVGAAWVFYDADLEQRISLADLVRAAVRAAGGGAELAPAERQAASRLLDGLGDGMPVSRRQLPELVDLPGDGPVNREQLAARVRQVIEAWAMPGGAEGNRDGEEKTGGLRAASVIGSSRKIVWPGQRAVPAKAVLTTEHATGLLAGPGAASPEQAWAVGHQRLTELAGRLAEQSPGGDVEAISEALARYARAWRDHAADVEELEEFRDRVDGSSNPLPREQQLEAAVRHAKDEITRARDELAALGVANPGRALQELISLLAHPVGGGLPGGGRGRSGRSEEQRGWRRPRMEADAEEAISVNRPQQTAPPVVQEEPDYQPPQQGVRSIDDGWREDGSSDGAWGDGGQDTGGSFAWHDAVLDLATGELSYGRDTVILPPSQAAVLAALIGANGQTVTPGQLITGPDQTQNEIRAAAAGLSEALGQLPGFSGRLVARGIGFRLVSVVVWNDVSIDPTTRALHYGDITEPLLPDEAAVLAALIVAAGQPRTPGQLATVAGLAASTVRGAVPGLREVLASLPGFRGEITPA